MELASGFLSCWACLAFYQQFHVLSSAVLKDNDSIRLHLVAALYSCRRQLQKKAGLSSLAEQSIEGTMLN